MKTKKISFVFKGKKFFIDVEKCGPLKQMIGLMFSRKEKAKALLFEFNNLTKMKIHSIFVFFSFVVIWLDKKNNVLGIKKIKPFTLFISFNKPYSKLLEIPMNKKYFQIVKFFVDD